MPRHHMTAEGPVPFTPEEEAEWDAMEAAWAASENDRLAKDARDKRNLLLAQTDWRAAKAFETGAPLTGPWADYRQALRDVPQQAGFPTTINWPVPPEVA